MRRTFTVELTTREAQTVHRMARSGVTPDVIVQALYRSTLFDAAVSLRQAYGNGSMTEPIGASATGSGSSISS